MKRAPETFVSSSLFEAGIGHVIVARYKGSGVVEAGVFLLDVWCLGVKDAYFFKDDETAFQSTILRRLSRDSALDKHPGAWGRKLVEDCVAYAQQLGFAPHSSYKKACRVFGGIHAADCAETFSFGKDGKPFYVPGPHESHSRVHQIAAVLEGSCGPDGFGMVHECQGRSIERPEDVSFYAAASDNYSDEIAPELVEYAQEFLGEDKDLSAVSFRQSENLADYYLRGAKTLEGDEKSLESKVRFYIGLHTLIQAEEKDRSDLVNDLPEELRESFAHNYKAMVESGMVDKMKDWGLMDVVILRWKLISVEQPSGEKEDKLLLLYTMKENVELLESMASNLGNAISSGS